MCFPVNFAKFLRTSFLSRTTPVADYKYRKKCFYICLPSIFYKTISFHEHLLVKLSDKIEPYICLVRVSVNICSTKLTIYVITTSEIHISWFHYIALFYCDKINYVTKAKIMKKVSSVSNNYCSRPLIHKFFFKGPPPK